MVFVPSSLTEGLLVEGRTELSARRHVDFVTLHEYGHIAAKRYFHPASARDYGRVHWFEELVATYFGYAFVRAVDPEWAAAARKEWAAQVDGYTPRALSLDWRFMRGLPPDERARTYGWYQFLLNLRAAEIYDQHDVAFLRALKEALPWDDMGSWTTASLLPMLDRIAPGFEAWAEQLHSGR